MAKTNFSSILGDYMETGEVAAGGDEIVQRVPLEQIIEDPENPRRFVEQAKVEEMAASVKERGVLQPISLRPKNDDGFYVIRFGHRRYQGSKLAGLVDVPAIIKAGDDDPAETLIDQLVENDQRADLSTADMAEGVGRLIKLGLTQVEIGKRLGRPKDQVSRYASVLTMPEPLQVLAKSVGIGTVTSLHQAWKRDQAAVESLLADRDPESITQADARAIAARSTEMEQPSTLKDPGGRSEGPSTRKDTPAAVTSAAAPITPSGKAKRGKGRAVPAIVVEVDGRRGRLAAKTVLVVFDDNGATEQANVANMRFLPSGEGSGRA